MDDLDLPGDVKKVTVIGSGIVECEVAYSLAYEKGLEVTVVEMQPNLVTSMVQANRSMMLWMMMGKGSPSGKQRDTLEAPVKAFTASRVVKFAQGKVVILPNSEAEGIPTTHGRH